MTVALGYFWATLVSLWDHFGHLMVAWGSLEGLKGGFGITLGVPWGHCGVTLRHFGVTLGHFAATLGCVG